MTTRSPFSKTRGALSAAMLSAALLVLSGCPTQKDLDAMPSLLEVTPTGPAGKKCYDTCAHAKVACDEMCPNSIGICQDDCFADSKQCLVDCPEMQRPTPPKK